MKFAITTQLLKQVHLQTGHSSLTPVTYHPDKNVLYKEEHELLQSRILQLCPSHIWPKGSHDLACPRPILIADQHKEQLFKLHSALSTAITDIVERWWTDADARFPARMPLGPDFLVEEALAGAEVENFRITEINGRFSFNGFMHQAYGQASLDCLGLRENGAVAATDPAELLCGLLELFNPDLPLHLLKGQELGIDIHMVIDFLHRQLGTRPRLVTPADLRVLPDPQNTDQLKLYCIVKDSAGPVNASSPQPITIDGETVEEVHQVGLELHQHELFGMPREMLRQLSLRCFNDLRTILLVHDKRMLGVVKQEIPSLVARRILTLAQGEMLERGIADTILPGSAELNDLIQGSIQGNAELREEYLLKPIRGGKGAGIVFGDEMDPSEWVHALERLRTPSLEAGATTYVVQRRVHPRLYEVVLKSGGDQGYYPLIGTYHAVHGRCLGFGIWRSSPQRICAVSNGGSWMCTIMKKTQ
ncbi:hypothetical protein FE257_008944 [Aspergillus nanangensis]|uniref:Uncharacterized protein n=1 Tax=Aspergillus nanangensis TaxID=2582783 RepID=A0AAD4CY76_ASPNN|nr:hypothetical protein FE257_008944 [Aspergillus nanangensis]